MAGSVHVKRRLTDLSVHYPWMFKSIGEEFFPTRPTEFLTDQFAVWSKSNLLSLDELSPLGDDEAPPDVELVQSADISFSCQVFGIQSPGKWITQKNADPSLDYETERTIQLTSALRLRLEYLRVVQRLRSTTYMTNNSTLSSAQRFDNTTSSQSLPITTMRSIVTNMAYLNMGKRPNKIAMTSFTLIAIANSEEFKDLTKYTSIQNLEGEELSGLRGVVEQLIGVQKGAILISDATYNVAAANQTPIYTTFMGSDIVFGYIEALGLRGYSLSAGFQWSAYSNDPQAIIAVPRYDRTVVPVEDLRAFCVIDPKIIVTDLGYVLKGCLNTANYNNLVSY